MRFEVNINNFDRTEWERCVRQFTDYSIYQTWPYQQVRAEMEGQEISRAIVKDENDNVVVMCQVRIKHVKLLRLKIGYVQFGPLVRGYEGTLKCDVESLKVLQSAYLGDKVNVLRVVPNICNDESGKHLSDILSSSGFQLVRSVKLYHTMMFPLDISEKEMRCRLGRGWRSSLRKAERMNIEIRHSVDEECFQILDGLYKSAQNRKGFKGIDVSSFAKTQRLLSPGQKMNVVMAYDDGEPLTVDVTSNLGDTAVGIFQASSQKGLKLGSSYLVWWHALLAAKRAGMKRYDLGGVDPDKNPNVYQFKARMGGEDAYYVGAFEATTNTIIKNMWHIGEKIYRIIKK